MTEEELDKLFDEMRLGPPPIGGGEESLLPMMETMMQSLLSKDLLYPAIRDLADKFPGWLAEKGGDLPPEQLAKFRRQFELSKQASAPFSSDKLIAARKLSSAPLKSDLPGVRVRGSQGEPVPEDHVAHARDAVVGKSASGAGGKRRRPRRCSAHPRI